MVISAFQDGACLLHRVSSNAHLGTRRMALLSCFVANFCNRFSRNTKRQTVCLLNARLWNFRRTFSILSNLWFFILAYVTRSGKVTKAYKQKYGVENLFFLISRFIIELRNCNKQVVLLGDLNAYTTDAFGWNGRDALWSDVADIEFHRRVSACTRLSIGMGKIYSGSARAASFVF